MKFSWDQNAGHWRTGTPFDSSPVEKHIEGLPIVKHKTAQCFLKIQAHNFILEHQNTRLEVPARFRTRCSCRARSACHPGFTVDPGWFGFGWVVLKLATFQASHFSELFLGAPTKIATPPNSNCKLAIFPIFAWDPNVTKMIPQIPVANFWKLHPPRWPRPCIRAWQCFAKCPDLRSKPTSPKNDKTSHKKEGKYMFFCRVLAVELLQELFVNCDLSTPPHLINGRFFAPTNKGSFSKWDPFWGNQTWC